MRVKLKRFDETFADFILGLCLSIVLFVSSKADGVPCAGVLDETNTTCYIYRSDARTWQESELICQSLGGHLVSIQSSSKSDAVISVLQSQLVTDDVWLGGHLEHLPHPASRLWRWISDCGRCGRDTNAALAVSAQGCYKDQTTVHDLPYNISRLDRILTPAACIEACRNGGFWFAGVQSGNRCFCGNSFGLYGSIDSSVDTNNCVIGCSGDSSLRCGGPDLNFIYYVPGGYAEWGYAKPNNYRGYQTCTLLGQTIEFKFDDDDCGTTMAGFICDIPKTACVNGSVQLNDTSCYYISTTESVSWFKAREDCLRRGGDLLKVKDQVQLKTIKSSKYLKAPKYWIGLVGLVWFWTNGADLTYSNWYDVGGNEDWEPNEVDNECIIISPEKNFQWMDSNCNLLHGYLCEISMPETSTVQTTTQHLVTESSSLFSATDPENVFTTDQIMTSSQDIQTTAELVFTLTSSSRSQTTANHSQGESHSQTPSPNQITRGASTDNKTGLTSVEKALIAICVILFIVMIVILVMLLLHRYYANRNKVDGDRVEDVRDASSIPENTIDKQTLFQSNNHNKETDRIVSTDAHKRTRLTVQ